MVFSDQLFARNFKLVSHLIRASLPPPQSHIYVLLTTLPVAPAIGPYGRTITELLFDKNVEGSGQDLVWSTILTFAWRDWQGSRNPSVRTVGVLSAILSGRSPNTSEQREPACSGLSYMIQFSSVLNYFKKGKKEYQEHWPETSGWIGHCETSFHSHQRAQNTRLMKKQRIWDKVRCIAEIKMNDIRLSLRVPTKGEIKSGHVTKLVMADFGLQKSCW